MAKKVILIVLGALLVLCGIGSLAGSGALLAATGSSGTLRSGYHALSTPTVGFLSDPANLENSSNVTVSGGGVSVTVNGKSTTGTPLFIGVGPAAQVESYLAGAPYELVTKLDFSPYHLTTTTQPGDAQPGTPANQPFWVAQASGTDPNLVWKLANGDYRLVVMNADASPNVRLDARIGVKAPFLGGIGIAGLVCGALVVLLGLVALIWGIRSRRRVTAPAAAYPGAYSQSGATGQPGSTPYGAPYGTPPPYGTSTPQSSPPPYGSAPYGSAPYGSPPPTDLTPPTPPTGPTPPIGPTPPVGPTPPTDPTPPTGSAPIDPTLPPPRADGEPPYGGPPPWNQPPSGF